MSHQNKQHQTNNQDDNNKKCKSVRIFDWIKAAKLIKEYHIQNASIGYDHTIEKTFTILKNGKPVENNDDLIPLFDDANPVLIDNDRREIMNCFVVIHDNDNIHLFESGKTMLPLRWPKEALEVIDRSFYRKDIQESKYFQLLLSHPLLYFWPLLG